MAQQGGRIDFQVGFKTDKSGIQELKKSLQDIQNIKLANFDGSKQDLREVKNIAGEVSTALQKAFNPSINSINLKTFDEELKTSKLTIEQIYSSFSKAGAQGQVAFSQMARSVLTTNQQLKQTHSIINQMGTTFINTIKWNIASSAMNAFTSSVQGAFTYVESLEKSLTNIRIVTGDSQQKMEQFADSANRAAQELGRSTMDYSKAALTFYQQGLDEEAVQARTEAVLKAQNITGAGSQMADYLTAVWNGYKVANEQAQLYVDKLAAVADSSASDMSQLAVAMSKVASTANNMGVDVDQLNAQIATVVATTRQAPQAVGTAFKTIYTRMNDIKTGSDEAEISLGNYSGKMAELGFNVLDATGHLRDTGQVMQEIGGRWQNLTKQQQIYLATTMGGQRQVNQLIALFDNWTTYSELLNTSLESEGTLAEKNSRYMESLGAKMEQLGAAGERVKASLIDSESFGNVIELLTTGTNLLGGFIESIGGGGTALLGLGGIATQVFSGVLTKQISTAITNFENLRHNEEMTRQELEKTKEFGQMAGFDDSIVKSMVNAKSEMQQYYSVMTTAQRESFNNIVNNIGKAEEEVRVWKQKIEQAENFNKGLQSIANNLGISLEEQQSFITDYLQQIQKELNESFKIDLTDLGKNSNIQDLLNSFLMIGSNIDTAAIPGLDKLIDKLDEAQKEFYEAKEDFEQFGGDENEIALSAKASRVRELIRQMVQSTQQANNNRINIEANASGLQQAQAKLKNFEKEAKDFRAQIEKEYNIKNIVNMVGAFGQVASAISSLQNIGNIISNESLSSGQKAIKIMTALSYAATSLSMAYGKINTVLHLTETLQIIQNAFQVKQTALLAAQTGEVNLLTIAKTKLTAATYALNTAMLVNPAVAIAAGIGLVITAVAGAIAIYDKFTMSTKEAEQAIENFNQKANQTRESVKTYNSDLTNLEDAKKEWQELSKRAGSYNSTIDNLTEDEKTRYYELSNLIAQYNDGAVAGYDEQGNAIIRNNAKLEETIALLKEKRQAQIDSFVNSDDFKDKQKADQTLFDNASLNKDTLESNIESTQQDLLQKLQYRGQSLSAAFEQYNASIQEEFKAEKERLDQILALGTEGILQNRQELILIFQKFQDNAILPADYNASSVGDIQNLNEALNKAKEDLAKAEKQFQDFQEINVQDVLSVLQSKNYNELYKQAEETGITNINSILSSYIAGMSRIDEDDGHLRSYQEIAQKVNDDFLSTFNETLGKIDSNGQSAYQNLFNAVLKDEDLQKDNFANLNQKKQHIAKILEDFFNSHKQIVNKLASESDETKAAFQQTFADMFNVDGLEINFDTGKVQNLVNKKVQVLYDRIKDAMLSKAKSFKDVENMAFPSQDIIAQLLPPDVTDAELDYIIEHIEQAYQKTGDVEEAIKSLREQASNLSNLDENISTIGLLNKQEAGEKLGDKQLAELQKGLDTLKETYGDLDGAISTLQNKWMQGTTQYTQALAEVKAAVYNGLIESFVQGGITQDQYNQKVMSLISSMESLQQAWDLLDMPSRQQALMTVASQYESCRDELQAYNLAIQQGNEQQQSAAMQDLARATYSEELGQQYGIQAERISDLSSYYAELAQKYRESGDASLEMYQGLDANAELATDMATRYIRLNDAIEDMQKNYDDMTQLLDAFADDSQNLGDIIADNSQAYQSLKEDIAGIIDVSQDMIDQDWGEWISQNAGLLKQAMEGSQQAIDKLRQSAAEKIEFDLNADNIDISGLFDTLDMAYDSVAEWANNLPEGQLTGDDAIFLQTLANSLAEAGYTADQIENVFSGLGIDADVVAAPLEESFNEIKEAADNAAAGVEESLTNAANNSLDAISGNASIAAADMENQLSGGAEAAADNIENSVIPASENAADAITGNFSSASANAYNETTTNIDDMSNDMADTVTKKSAESGQAIVQNLGIQSESNTEIETSTDRAAATSLEASLQPVQSTTYVPQYTETDTPFGPFYTPAGVDSQTFRVYGVRMQADPIQTQVDKEVPLTSVKVNNATKSAGGRISHKNRSGGNRKSSGGKKSGGGKKGGGKKSGGKKSTANKDAAKAAQKAGQAAQKAAEKQKAAALKQAEKEKKQAEKKAQQAEKAAEKARQQAEKAAKEEKKAAEKRAEEAKKAAEKARQEAEKKEKQLEAAAEKAESEREKAKEDLLKQQEQARKQAEANRPEFIDVEEDIPDRYHYVNLALQDISIKLSRIQEEQDKLTGKKLIQNLEKQQKLLDKQVDTYKNKIQLERQEADQLRNALRKTGVQFDKNGNVTNYFKALQKALDKYNNTIHAYNKLSTKEEQQAYKQKVDKAKQEYQKFKDNLERYTEIISDEIPGLQDDITKAINETFEIAIQKFKIDIDLKLDTAEAEQDLRDFRNKVVKQLRDDNVLGQAKALVADYKSYYKDGNNIVQQLTKQIVKTQSEINSINRIGSSAVYGTDKASALEDLKKYTDELMDSLQDIEKVVTDIKDTIFDAIDKAQKGFDNQKKTYEQISDLIDHNRKVVQLLYGKDANDSLDKYYKLQEKNNKSQLDFLEKQKDLWYARMEVERKRMDKLPQDSNAWKEAKQRFDEYKQHWMDSLKELNKLTQDSIQNIIDKYSNTIDKVFTNLENKLTKNKGFENLSEEWELINKQADMYLDQVNSMYETDKLENAYKDAIKNNEGNVKAQKSLNNMMNEQLKYLRDKDKLTQYDVDRANALLQIEIKRLALENQRQNKTKLRLRRDSQGNYTYQYTADEQAKEQAQQELADAENSLYNMTKQAYKNNLDSYYKTVTEWQDNVKDVYKDTTLTVDQQQQKVAMLNEYYGDIINGMTQNNEDLKKFMMEDTFNEMAKMYDINVENYKAMTDKQKNIIMEDMVPYWKSGIQQMADTVINSETGFLPLTENAFKEVDKATKDYTNSLKAIEKYADNTFEQTAKGIDTNITKTQELLQNNKDLINAYADEIKAVQKVINNVEKLAESYKKAKNEAIEAVQAASNLQKSENAATGKAAEGSPATVKYDNAANQKTFNNQKQEYKQATTEQKNAQKINDLLKLQQEANIQKEQVKLQAKQEAERKELEEKQRKERQAEKKAKIDLENKLKQQEIKRRQQEAKEEAKARVQASIRVNNLFNKANLAQNTSLAANQLKTLKQVYVDAFDYFGDKDAVTKLQNDLVSKGLNLKDNEVARVIGQYQKELQIYTDYIKKATEAYDKQAYYEGLDASQYATGGYTGDWGENGKLAVLHEKELILNKDDTEKMLSAISVVRTLDSILNGFKFNSNDANSNNIINSLISNAGATSASQQYITINADFPAVKDRLQIEAAFDNLVNRASQFAFSNRK